MCRAVFLLISFVLSLSSLQILAQSTYTADQAKSHIGERGTVCGVVASAHFAASSKGRPTFLNLDKPYPNQIFTVLIWGSDRQKFGTPERDYNKKNVCVTGTIEQFRGAAEIIARNPSEIKIK
jgi:micrococcal nuclease